MSQQSRLVAGLLSQLTTILLTVSPVLAQAAFETNKIVSCIEDPTAHTVTLVTAKHMPLTAPLVSYLPGDDGETIMVVDFQGLTWNLPTRIIRSEQLDPRFRGIQEVRIGRFQESPPICRISIVARDPRAFKLVSFKATNSALTVKWSLRVGQGGRAVADSSARSGVRAARQDLGPRYTKTSAPEVAAAQSNEDTQDLSNQDLPARPPARPLETPAAVSSRPAVTNWRGSEKSLSRPYLIPLAPAIKRQAPPNVAPERPTEENAQPAADGQIPDLPPVTITASSENFSDDPASEALRLSVKASHPLAYTTFRLHDPERYVIDFSNCIELTNASLPDLSTSSFVRSIRVGQPDDETKTRLVLDLSDSQILTKERMGGDSESFSVRLSRTSSDLLTAAANLHMPSGTVVVLDAGHGGTDPGAQRGDVQEKEITMGIVAKLKNMLEARGTRVVLTRADDTFVSLEDRVKITNNLNPTLFLSVHINAMESANDIHGIETYYQTEQSKLLADSVHERLVAGLEAPDRSIRKARFYVIRNTPVPAVLAEVGFISNKDERDKLISSDYQAKVAEALEQGVMLYLDKRLALQGSGRIEKANDGTPPNNSASSVGTNKTSGKSNHERIANTHNYRANETR